MNQLGSQIAADPTPEASAFLERVRRCHLLNESELNGVLEGLSSQVRARATDLAAALVCEGLLNEYQAQRLLSEEPAVLVLDDYRILGCLGRGDRGTVCKAEHARLKRLVTIKVLAGEGERHSPLLALVQSELHAMQALRHPNLVLPLEAGETETNGPHGRIIRYLVMEHIHGRDLERVVREEGPLPIVTACAHVGQAAEALRHAYEHGLTHRRLRPSKLMLTPQGQIKVLGLGEERLWWGSAPPGTARPDEYIAPELAGGRAPADVRADIYSLGAILYWLLTGQRPFANDPEQRRSLVPLRRLRPEAPLELEAVVCQMMARDPSDRYATPLAALMALNVFREMPMGRNPLLHLSREQEVSQVQDALLFAMARMAEIRGLETEAHLLRMQQYVRVLAETAMQLPAFSERIDAGFIRLLERSVVLHDVGKVAIPDHVLLKPGKLDPEERSIMESHTVLGANFLEALAQQPGSPPDFLQMALDIARHHHERWDGTGYPDGLPGEAIPLAARITMFADVYDALRSRLVYKPGLAHTPSRRLILEAGHGQFDPNLLVAFRQCEGSFQHIFEMSEPYGS